MDNEHTSEASIVETGTLDIRVSGFYLTSLLAQQLKLPPPVDPDTCSIRVEKDGISVFYEHTKGAATMQLTVSRTPPETAQTADAAQ